MSDTEPSPQDKWMGNLQICVDGPPPAARGEQSDKRTDAEIKKALESRTGKSFSDLILGLGRGPLALSPRELEAELNANGTLKKRVILESHQPVIVMDEVLEPDSYNPDRIRGVAQVGKEADIEQRKRVGQQMALDRIKQGLTAGGTAQKGAASAGLVRPVQPAVGKTEPKNPPPITAGQPQARGLDAPAPSSVDPLGRTQVDALGKTHPAGVDSEKVGPGDARQTYVPPTVADRKQPGTGQPVLTPASRPINASQSPEQIRQDLLVARAAREAAVQAQFNATQEFLRYRASEPNPKKGLKGDPNWDSKVDKELDERARLATEAAYEAAAKLSAAEAAIEKAAADAAAQERRAQGRGGFPPPKH